MVTQLIKLINKPIPSFQKSYKKPFFITNTEPVQSSVKPPRTPWIIVNRKRPLTKNVKTPDVLIPESVDSKIASIHLESLFEIAKLMGSIRSGQPLKDKDRLSAGKAVIEKVLEVLGFDYK